MVKSAISPTISLKEKLALRKRGWQWFAAVISLHLIFMLAALCWQAISF